MRRASADAGTVGALLDALDAAHPIQPELDKSQRPYAWEAVRNSVDMVRLVNERPLTRTGYLLSYWQNQSGGSAWGWRLGFGDAREAADFLCVVGHGLGCEPDGDDAEFDQGSAPRLTDEMLAAASMRSLVLRLASKGAADAFKSLRDRFNQSSEGDVEFVLPLAKCVTSTQPECKTLRATYRAEALDDDDDGAPSPRPAARSSPLRANEVAGFLDWLKSSDA